MEAFALGLLVVLVLMLLVAVVVLLVQVNRPREEAQAAIVAERLSQLEPVARAVGNLQVGLGELQAYARARQDLERQTAESIRRLETVIAGTRSKGAAGENLLDAVFARLPVEWQARNFRVGNKVVEFGLRLPNGLVLPIDSKWPATNLVEQLAACEDPAEQQRLKAQVESAVLAKARETQKYVDPDLTTGFAIAAVPDAVFDLCAGVQAAALQMNVALVSYSMFVPYLLLVFQMALKLSRGVDARRLEAYLGSVEQDIRALQDEVEGRLPRAIVMLTNSRGEMGVHLSRLMTGLTGLQVAASATAPPMLEEAPEDGAALTGGERPE